MKTFVRKDEAEDQKINLIAGERKKSSVRNKRSSRSLFNIVAGEGMK